MYVPLNEMCLMTQAAEYNKQNAKHSAKVK